MRSLVRRVGRKVKSELARVTRDFPARWPKDRRVVSFTFDDFPASAASTGAKLLDKHGASGTFFACFGSLGSSSPSGTLATPADLRALNDAGHEIACHTYSHINCLYSTRSTIASEILQNRKAALALGLPPLSTFAFPFGALDRAARSVVAAEFQVARAVWRGVNTGVVDRYSLRAIPLMKRDRWAAVDIALRTLQRVGGWAVFYTHDIDSSPSAFGCTPDEFAAVCSAAKEMQCEILTVREAAGLLGP